MVRDFRLDAHLGITCTDAFDLGIFVVEDK